MGQNGERVTRSDVAKAAGVSETIVSYVINNNRYVAKEKRQRVEEAIAALHYRPNNVARALKGKRSNQLLFIADQITNEYFSRIVSEMDKYAYEAGFLISLCANRNTPEFVSQVISRQYDGIIISSISFPMTNEVLKVAKCFGVPVEAEIGELLRLDGQGAVMENKNIVDPEEVKAFLELCRPDSLAIGIGNAHGYYRGEPDIHLEVLEAVRRFTDIPLVLHAA